MSSIFRPTKLILLCLVVGFLCILNILRFSPIFTDEISFKLIFSRYFLENGKAIFFFPQCKPQFSTHFPIFFIPFRILDSLLYENMSNPLKLRYWGIAYYLMYLCCFGYAVSLLQKDLKTLSKQDVFALTLSLNTIGGIPFLLDVNRPEMPMAIFVFVLIILPLIQKRISSHQKMLKEIILFSSFFFVCGTMAYHAKGLCFLPLFLTTTFFLSGNWKKRIAAIIFILFVSYSSFSFWTEQFNCPLDKTTQNKLADFGISHMSHNFSLKELTLQIFQNLKGGIYSFSAPHFTREAVVQAGLELPNAFNYLWRAWNYFFYLSLILLGIVIFISFLFIKKSRLSELKDSFTFWLFLSILLIVFGNQAITTRKAWYDLSLLFPLFFFLVLTAISFYPTDFQKKLFKFGIPYIYALALSSQLIFILIHTPIIPNWIRGGWIEDNYFATSAYNIATVNARVVQLAEKCKIKQSVVSNHLVVDEISYPSFWNSKEPYFALFTLSCYGQKQLERNPIEFLTERNSDGFIGSCRYLTSELLPFAIRDKELCCLPAFKAKSTVFF